MAPTEPAVRCNGQSRLVPRDKGAFFLLFSASNAYLHSPETEYKITGSSMRLGKNRVRILQLVGSRAG